MLGLGPARQGHVRPSIESGPGTIYCGRGRAWLRSGPPGGGGTRGGGRWGAPVGVLDGEVEVEGLQQDALAHEDLLLERPELPRLRVGCGRRVVLRLVPARESGRRSSVWGALSRAGLWLRRGWGHRRGHIARYHRGYLYARGAGPQSLEDGLVASKGLGPLATMRGSALAHGCGRGGRVVLPPCQPA